VIDSSIRERFARPRTRTKPLRLAGYTAMAGLLGFTSYRLAGALDSVLLGILAAIIVYLGATSIWCSIRNRGGVCLR
jgi:hypothetical protein